MPELPEVETVVRDLRPLLVGQRIDGVWVGRLTLRKPWSKAWNRRLKQRRVEAIQRRGKWIVLELDDGGRVLFHLGMTGQLTMKPAAEPLRDHTHLKFDFEEGAFQLRFRDVRRFGSATVFQDAAALNGFFEKSGLGPEPFGLDAAYWRDRLAATSRCLKALLLDQRVVAGVGNIYADEALFEARLHPTRAASTLDVREADRLRGAIEIVLNRAIGRCGTSFDNAYVGGQNKPCVYGRPGEPCPKCGTSIDRIRLAGRSTHSCPACQKSHQPSVAGPQRGKEQRGKRPAAPGQGASEKQSG